jgi:hypothetical protein
MAAKERSLDSSDDDPSAMVEHAETSVKRNASGRPLSTHQTEAAAQLCSQTILAIYRN